MTNQTIRKNKK